MLVKAQSNGVINWGNLDVAMNVLARGDPVLNDFLPDIKPRNLYASGNSTLVTKKDNKSAQESCADFAKQSTMGRGHWFGKIGSIHICVMCGGKMKDMVRLTQTIVDEIARGDPSAFVGNCFFPCPAMDARNLMRQIIFWNLLGMLLIFLLSSGRAAFLLLALAPQRTGV